MDNGYLNTIWIYFKCLPDNFLNYIQTNMVITNSKGPSNLFFMTVKHFNREIFLGCFIVVVCSFPSSYVTLATFDFVTLIKNMQA